MSTLSYYYNDKKLNVHHPCLPYSFRMLIVGSSGCGKTTLLMKLLLQDNLLNYDKLYVFARSLHQPEYECLIEGFRNRLPKTAILGLLNTGEDIEKKNSSIKEIAKIMGGLCEEKGTQSEITAEFYNTPEKIPDPSDLETSRTDKNGEKQKVRNLMIFDDIMTDKK